MRPPTQKRMQEAGNFMRLNALGYAVIKLIEAGHTLDEASLLAHLQAEQSRSTAADQAHHTFQAALQALQDALDARKRNPL